MFITKKDISYLLVFVALVVMGTYVFNKVKHRFDLPQPVLADEYDNDGYNDDNDDDEYDKDDDGYDKDDSYDDEYDKDDDGYDKDDSYDDDEYDKDEYDEYTWPVTGTKQTTTTILVGSDEYDEYAQDEYTKDDDEYDEYDEIVKETINNDDGTITFRVTKIGNEETEITETTVDADGNKLMVKKTESEEGKEEVELKTFDVYGEKILDYELKTEDGKIVKIEYKEEGEKSKYEVKFDVQSRVLVIESKNEDEGKEVKIATRGNNFVITRAETGVLSGLPLVVVEEEGEVLVATSGGNVALDVMPDGIAKIVSAEGKIDKVESTELEDDDGLKYVLSGEKNEKLLGIFSVKVETEVKYDAQTGQFLEENRSWYAWVIDFLSV